MIITKQKYFDDIYAFLKGYTNIFIIGCGECATQCKTGGEKEIEDMKKVLSDAGKTISGSAVIEATCHELNVKKVLREHKEKIAVTHAILVLSCGGGVQSVGEALDIPVISGCDTLFLGNIERMYKYSKKCSICGDCKLNLYGAICPVTRCSKGLMNGPCGGARAGNCEADETVECVWVKIYERLSRQGRKELLYEIYDPREHTVINKRAV